MHQCVIVEIPAIITCGNKQLFVQSTGCHRLFNGNSSNLDIYIVLKQIFKKNIDTFQIRIDFYLHPTVELSGLRH